MDDLTEQSNSIKDISLNELADIEHLSIRAINVCCYSKLLSLDSILKHFNLKHSFLSLNGCGLKTENELLSICNKYQIEFPQVEHKRYEYLIDTIHSFNQEQLNVLNIYYKNILSNLDARSYKALLNISATLNLKEIIEAVIIKNYNFLNIYSLGKKSVVNLNEFKQNIIHYIQHLRFEEFLSKENLNSLIIYNFSKLFKITGSSTNNYIENDKIKLFKIVNDTINMVKLFPPMGNKVFFILFTNIYEEEKTALSNSLKQREKLYNYARLRILITKRIINYFQFISQFSTDNIFNYEIDKKDSCLIIDDKLVENINKSEEVNFNITFYSLILGVFLTESHTSLENIKTTRYKNGFNIAWKFKNFYFIRNDIYNNFNFELFFNDFSQKLDKIVFRSYSLNFTDYLSNFLNNDKKYLLNDIKVIIKKIINIEYNIEFNAEGDLTFIRNTNKPITIYSYIYNVLVENDDWMTLNEIAIKVKLKYPTVKIDKKSARAIMLANKELFICKGRNSTYALAKWEKEKSNVKRGTISDIAYEYLLKETEPKHVSDIVNYVNQFSRSTYEKSVLVILNVEYKQRFVIFNGDYIGLSSNKYPKEYILKPTLVVKSWEENYYNLKTFLYLNNNKIPQRNKYDNNENHLSMFCVNNLMLYRNSKLNNIKADLLREIGIDLDKKHTKRTC